MEFFPQALDLNLMVSKLYTMPVRVQFCHHLTTSYAAHKALDGAYDSLNDLKDSITEKLIGYSGKRFTQITIPSQSSYSENLNIQVAQEIIALGNEIEEYGDKNGWCDIENLGQEYSGVGAQLAYLLTLK